MHYWVVRAAELLGLPLIPPHSEASGKQMKRGVNFASAASGILDITGRNFVSFYFLINNILFHANKREIFR